jgi:hypothetical protein
MRTAAETWRPFLEFTTEEIRGVRVPRGRHGDCSQQATQRSMMGRSFACPRSCACQSRLSGGFSFESEGFGFGATSVGPGADLTRGTAIGFGLALLLASTVFTFWESGRDLVPSRSCQVDPALLSSGRSRAAMEWGKQLGTGVRSHLVTPAFYGFLGFALASGPVRAFGLSVIYGAARSAAIGTGAIGVARRRARCTLSLEPGLGLERRSRGIVGMALLASSILLIGHAMTYQ